MIKKQRGFGGFEIMILLVVLGIVGGALTYHWSVVSGLETQVADKTKTINDQAADIGTLTASNAALKVANSNFERLALLQNNSIKNIRVEREEALAKWKAAMEHGAVTSTQYQQSIDKILSTQLKPGQDWCSAFTELLDAHLAERKKDKVPR